MPRAADPPRDTEPEEGLAWEPFLGGLRAFVARRVPRQDSDDVTQEVLLRLYQGQSSLRQPTRAEAWIYGIARRTIADYYRRRPALEAAGSDGHDLPAEATGTRGFATFAGDHDPHEEVLSWLRPMVDELPDLYREALLAADFEGKTQRQIAEELGMSLSGVKSRVQRARALLGENLHRCCEVALGDDGRVVDFHRRSCDC